MRVYITSFLAHNCPLMELEEIKNMKIFIVDDSPILRTRLNDAMADIGEAEIVGEADSALDAIAAIKQTQPQVIVLDIRLRVGTGLDVLREIKRDVNNPVIVIVITNYPYEQYRRVSMSIGADYFFHKATQFVEVINVLKELQQLPQRETHLT